MKYISIGNSHFNKDIIYHLGFYEFNITYPFDNCISTISVVNDCLNNGWEKFLELDNPQTGLDNDDLIIWGQANHDDFDKLNAYQCQVYFPGIPINNNDDAKYYLQYYIDNMMNAINSSEDITFIFTNQIAMYVKDFRDKQELYYHKLLEFVDILKTKYNKSNIKILAFFVNQSFTDTAEVQTYSIPIEVEYISDNHESHYPESTFHFMDLTEKKLVEILNL